MPRHARAVSETGIYHIIVRGINRTPIFHDNEDRQRYLGTLARITSDSQALLLGYCLMDNHVHILLKEGAKSISNVMHRLGASYYNWKYERAGHVFQNRFKSENVEDDSYLQTVLRYIHQNPVKAGMSSKPELYIWSSCQVYYGGKDYLPGLTSIGLVLSLFGEYKEKSIKELRLFTNTETTDKCMEDIQGKILTETQARQVVEERSGKLTTKIQELTKPERDKILHELKLIEGLSIRQISRITGLGFNIVKRA